MISPFLSENELEMTACKWLEDLGWKVENWKYESFPNSERESRQIALLENRLEAALRKFNPDMPEAAISAALSALRRPEYDNLTLENERLHNLLIKGVNVSIRKSDGTYKHEYASVIDFKNPEKNDFLAVRQLWMQEGRDTRCADIALYLNGMMVGLIELKSPSNDSNIEDAYGQLQTYKAELPAFLRFNEFLIISDGITSRIGSLTANFRRFMNWRTSHQANGDENLKNLLKGVCEKKVFLDLISCAIAFKKDSKESIKILAGYHQYYALKKAIPHILEASRTDQRGGVIWHTQGAGKSLLMAFLARALIQQAELRNPTLLILTDRNDLDDQLYQTFWEVQDFLTTTPQQAKTRDDLRRLLNRNNGGIIFSTLQKFGLSEDEEEMPRLSERQNIIVLADEAHRSQYGLGDKFNPKSGQIKSGLAQNVRDALPKATFVGFTGTPLEKEDKSTTGLFGAYLDIYDISQAVLDEVTVPVYYEPHLIPLDLDKDALEEIREKYDAVAEEEEENVQRQLAYLQMEKLMGSKPRLKRLAEHLVAHFETRQDSQEVPGKGMIVGFSRKVCADLYEEIIALRPEWHNDSDDKGAIKVIMTSAASDGPELAKHKSTKQRLTLLAERIKNPEDPLQLVIVRDMWLTGFDAPCLNVLYIDKPMKEHGLMQAMARVNRVSKGKKAGLVVDYVGIAEALRKALNHYTKNSERSGEKEMGVNIEIAIKELEKRFKIVQDFFNPSSPQGINYPKALGDKTSHEERLRILRDAVEHILALRQKELAAAKDDFQRKEARNRFPLAVKTLKTAWALVPSTDEAQKISKDLGFFLAVDSQIGKEHLKTEKLKSRAEIDQAIRHLMEKALHADETIDILDLMGIDKPEVEVLSEAFLHKLNETKQRNLAVEALERLLADRIQKISRTNQTKGGLFSEKLQELVGRYNVGQLTAAQMLEELIKHAKALNKEIQDSQESPFSIEEIAFYDALAKNTSAVEALKEPVLHEMATELVKIVKRNATVDWMRTEQGRAKMRIAIKRLLKKYKYPPDLEKEAITRIITQAELNASNTAS
ncbi:type I restriction endonuclease subunit R [Acetobacteraceae bacterium]|nr:type I restriction endonuclease subunit R [Acetobacteraceae bacterium]